MSAAMHDLALVMFDLDGTLVATAGEIQDAVNDTLAQFNLPPVGESQVEHWIGRGTRSLLALAASTGRTAAAVHASDSFEVLAGEFAVHYARRCGTRSWLYPHVRAVLERLRLHGVMLAVVTNKEEAFAAAVLDRHGLSPLLELVVCGDTAPAKKPDPAGLLACMAQLQVPAHRALFVGDSSIDAAAARAARVRFWAVDYGYNMGRPIARERPIRLMADVRPLLELTCGIAAPSVAAAGSQTSSFTNA
jgi:phosphoglycolate phosphatase